MLHIWCCSIKISLTDAATVKANDYYDFTGTDSYDNQNFSKIWKQNIIEDPHSPSFTINKEINLNSNIDVDGNTAIITSKRKRHKLSCPAACHCFTLNNAYTVNCETKNMLGIPESLDLSTKILRLNGNPGIRILQDKVFFERGSTSIQNLVLSHCSIHFIGTEAFYGLRFLKSLDLSHNSLTTIPSEAFIHTPFLKTLILSHNLIRVIRKNALFACSR
ncbi:unnamed protein product [Gordionus sp. m RMFG-2023]